MRLFHFTCLFHLPAILREGLTKGEVPAWAKYDYTKLPNAVNLTSDGTRAAQEWNAANYVDKTKVRLEVEVEEGELSTFNEVTADYETPEWWIKDLDPLNQRDEWFFAFKGIAASQITQVSIAGGTDNEYVAVYDSDLDELIAKIEEERKNLPLIKTAEGMSFEPEKAIGSWLLDGPLANKERKKQQREEATLRSQRERERKKKERKKARKQKKRNRR